MLCDDLIADKALLECYDGLDKVYARIKATQKFVLSKEFTIAADGLVDNLCELNKILPYCRLPFPRIWIEWVHDDRPHWDPNGPYGSRPVDPKRHQHPPHRCAFLLEQHDTPAQWKAHLFWSMKDEPVQGSRFNGSFQAPVINTDIRDSKDPMMDSLKPDAADFGLGLMTDLLEFEPAVAKRLLEYAQEDWGGEYRFMIAVLGLMNTRNVMQTVTVDNEKYNAKRIRHNKRPLFSHKILKVRPEIWARNVTQPVSHQHAELRLHFVQGHWKHRKTGLFYWSHHSRGSGKRGFVEKDYELT